MLKECERYSTVGKGESITAVKLLTLAPPEENTVLEELIASVIVGCKPVSVDVSSIVIDPRRVVRRIGNTCPLHHDTLHRPDMRLFWVYVSSTLAIPSFEHINLNDLHSDEVSQLVKVQSVRVRQQLKWRKDAHLDLTERRLLLVETVDFSILLHLFELALTVRIECRLTCEGINDELEAASSVIQEIPAHIDRTDPAHNRPPQSLLLQGWDFKLPFGVVQSALAHFSRCNITRIIAISNNVHDRAALCELSKLSTSNTKAVVNNDPRLLIAQGNRPVRVTILELRLARVIARIVIARNHGNIIPPLNLPRSPSIETILTRVLQGAQKLPLVSGLTNSHVRPSF